MAVSINGTTGISGVDGSASAPAIKGTDTNSGISYASDTVNINTGGSTRVIVDSSGNLRAGTITDSSGSNSSTTAQIAQGRAKAWITISSSTTILDSFNISALSDNGDGDFNVTFDTDFANDDYCASTMAATGDNLAFSGVDSSQAVGSCRVVTRTARTSGKTDFTIAHAIFFGDQ